MRWPWSIHVYLLGECEVASVMPEIVSGGEKAAAMVGQLNKKPYSLI